MAQSRPRGPRRESPERERIARKLRDLSTSLHKPPLRPAQVAAPVALFPLRLEYRVIEAGVTSSHATFSAASLRADRHRNRGEERGLHGPGRSAARSVQHLEFRSAQPQRTEIWLRWFPDDPFAAQGTPPIEPREARALEGFHGSIGSAAWWSEDSSAVRAAFAALAAEVGAWRALHLLRVPSGGPADWQSQVGRLAVLPERVALFAILGDELRELGSGKPVAADLRLSPEHLKPGGWLVDFSAAVAAGMGLRLVAPEAVSTALKAAGLIAVGVSSRDATAAVERFLADALANGGLELVPPGTPTNRVQGAATVFEREPADPAALLARATQRERPGARAAQSDAAQLATALGLDPQLLNGAPGAREHGQERARAMAQALLPGLTERFFREVPGMAAQRSALLAFLVEHAFARGPLSALRVGHTPYGVLPVTSLAAARAPGRATTAQRGAFQFCSRLASASLAWLSQEVAQLPIVRPDDPLAHEKLEEALRLQPVSWSAAVRNLPASKALVLRCPAVRGPNHEPAEYLRRLADLPLSELPRPDEQDLATPLLYRLVRLSREVLEASQQGSAGTLGAVAELSRTDSRARGRVTARNAPAAANLAQALHSLAQVDADELKQLLFEVLDLLDHRADAWFTALATSRLAAQRISQPTGLQAGWYGFIGQLRPQAQRSMNGFLVAPSVAQAVTAGMLRAAALRHPGTAFQIDLGSRRAGLAVRMLAAMGEGATLGQVLGDATARFLHERRHDFVLHALRSVYAAQTDSPPGATRPLDGLALHDDPDLVQLSGSPLIASLAPPERARTLARARAARGHAADAFDGLSDLVVAEAAHQLTLGNAGAAHAWMQVLSGDPPPKELVFLRTPRDGQGSTYRWSLVREPSAAHGNGPRARIEPSAAALASEILEDFEACRVGVSVPVDGGAPVALSLRLRAELGMEPIDLIVGGASEVRSRARFVLLRLWRENDELQAELGPAPEQDVPQQLAAQRALSFDFAFSANGSPTLDRLFERCKPLAELLTKARPLRVQDLAAAAAPGGNLEQSAMATAWRSAAEELVLRCATVEGQLAAAESNLRTRAAALETQARTLIAARAQSGLQAPASAAGLVQLRQRRDETAVALEACSRFALPDVLVGLGLEDLLTDPGQLEALAAHTCALLRERRTGLQVARANAESLAGTSLPDWQACVERLCTALRSAADGDALAVWPSYPRTQAVTPQVAQTTAAGPLVEGWPRLRPRLSAVARLEPAAHGMLAHVARPLAPAPVAPGSEPTRDELERPSSIHEAVFLGRDDVFARPRLCGAVIDEWSDERPSARQVFGLACRYDAPQSEAPKALLLGVPASDEQEQWSLPAVAALVRETMQWARVRSLPAARSSLSRVLAPLLSIVPPVSAKGKPNKRRLPTKSARWLGDHAVGLGLVIEKVKGVPTTDRSAGNLRRDGGP